MLSIDEAISKYKEITNTDANCPAHCNISCDKCVQESKQLVEWLEELVMLRLDSCMIHLPERLHLVENGYNKALNDFVNACKSNSLCQTFGLRQCDIEKIAEQLKAGGWNEE